ncbi:hypothetical protein RRG08_044136 [Elysia crispata]|uniref:Uncharacterized protein n=1 Tax=Elysia crispata TaxID=231223 RepID=A0AAE0Z7M0_9GAST|nr:hypothetical protein RRG08_044136 [Elysia crispata]
MSPPTNISLIQCCVPIIQPGEPRLISRPGPCLSQLPYHPFVSEACLLVPTAKRSSLIGLRDVYRRRARIQHAQSVARVARGGPPSNFTPLAPSPNLLQPSFQLTTTSSPATQDAESRREETCRVAKCHAWVLAGFSQMPRLYGSLAHRLPCVELKAWERSLIETMNGRNTSGKRR